MNRIKKPSESIYAEDDMTWSGDKDELVVTLKMAIAIDEWSQIIAMSSFQDIKKEKKRRR